MRSLLKVHSSATTWITSVFVLLLHIGGVRADDASGKGNQSLADQLVAEAKVMEGTDINQAIAMLKRREQEVKKVSSDGQMARYYNKLSEMNATISHLEEQRQYAEKGLALIAGETVAIGADLNYNLGIVYEMKADQKKALEHYRKGLEIAQVTGHRVYQGRGKLFISAIYSFENNYERALETMHEAYAISQEVGDDGLSWEVLNQLGVLYGELRDFDKALEINLQALEVGRRLNIKSLIIVVLHNIALTYLDMKDYDNANLTFEKMLDESKTSTELANMHSSYKGFAIIALELEDFKRALAYITKAEEYLPHVQQLLAQVEFYFFKADILSKLEQSNRALEVLAVAERTLPQEHRTNDSGWGLSLLRLKSRFYSELGQYKMAYDLLNQHADGMREYRRTTNDSAIARLRVSFDIERNETRNNILEKDNEIKALQLQQAKSERQIQTFFLIALAMLSLGLIFVMYRQLHSRRQLKNIAETDSLTELFNRRYAFSTGEKLAKECKEAKTPFSVIMFDLDNFKTINDTYGHPAGDQVLRNVGELSRSCLRGTDVAARIGGEEFIAILPGVKIEMAEFIAGRLKDKLETFEQTHEDNKFLVTASFGVATASDKDDFEQLIQRADKALYQAKDNGRNCVALAS